VSGVDCWVSGDYLSQYITEAFNYSEPLQFLGSDSSAGMLARHVRKRFSCLLHVHANARCQTLTSAQPSPGPAVGNLWIPSIELC
jgi:hypothetical protein